MSDVLPAQHPQALFTELDDGTGVLLHLETKFYFTLNQTAVFVWKALGARSAKNKGALAEAMTAEFRVDRETAERDIEELLAELEADGLVLPPR